ncbi:MAG: accessory gene regulator B family protein [Lachnospiraceae bacterium]
MGIVKWLIEKEMIDKEDKELYEYAMYSITISVVPLFLFLLISFLLGYLKESFFIVWPFMILRKFAGGFHANSVIKCFVFSNVLLFLGLYVVAQCKSLVWIFYLLAIATVLIYFLSPIDNEQYELGFKEKKKLKRICLVILSFCYIGIIIFYNLGYVKLSTSISVGIILVALLQVIFIFSKIFRNNKGRKLYGRN